MASIDDFQALDIRAGTITASKDFPEAVKPAYQLWIDFGEALGQKKSSAQLTDLYTKEELIGKQVLAVVNFPDRQIAGFRSEVLVLGLYSENGVVLIQPDKQIYNGSKLG
ncbi:MULTISPECIES: tRNA-binding protein [Sinobaca]|uniref:tRNA-binding protein n=1 Tax=Sinobaca qinghaiensis TaxID=342944 RepID=A0A419V8Z8_9BACL|nr:MULTISPECIES: tRNA-binding protein [Sinobaca]RKD76480.1 tRNA-binding protein [Sinobaca qinghaiensis]